MKRSISIWSCKLALTASASVQLKSNRDNRLNCIYKINRKNKTTLGNKYETQRLVS